MITRKTFTKMQLNVIQNFFIDLIECTNYSISQEQKYRSTNFASLWALICCHCCHKNCNIVNGRPYWHWLLSREGGYANGECVSSHDYTNLLLLSCKYCYGLSYSLCIIIQNHANSIPQAYLARVTFKEIESRATKINDYC